jgi:transposase
MLGLSAEDCDLRRWGLKLAERVGKNAKTRAVVVTRKLAILLPRLWISGEVYEPCEIATARQRQR